VGKKLRAAVVVAILFGASGCVVPPRPKPQRYSASEFRSRFATLCLASPELPNDLAGKNEREDIVMSAVTHGLAARGYEVVPTSEAMPLWDAAVAAEGGIYDPLDGTLDVAKSARARRAALRQMHEKLGCDALVEVTVAVVMAPFAASGEAHWDGVTYMLPGARGLIGRTPALSLWIAIVDLDDEEIYFGTGGIQLLGGFGGGAFSRGFALRDDEEILARSQALALGVQKALEGIDPSVVGPESGSD